ncbi:MAG: electron transport complex subunit E [Planctomycetes bacterium]|nr:electron transport complex subunit E [Planctomycetota bacterium]
MAVGNVFTRGFFKENPVFVLLLGLCPALAVTTGLKNALGMGLAATFVLVCSNLIVSLSRKFIPKEVRIPCFIVIIATFVTIVKMVMAAFLPELKEALGIFLPLIVVNCIILGRAEAFASKNKLLPSVIDGLGMGIGFTLAICIIGIVREILGAWMIFGIPITRGGMAYSMKVFILAPGGFLAMGLLLAYFNYLGAQRARRLALAQKGIHEGKGAPAVDTSNPTVQTINSQNMIGKTGAGPCNLCPGCDKPNF